MSAANFKGPGTAHYVLSPSWGVQYTVTPHGFIERIELVPTEDAPNMDASAPYQLSVELRGPNGRVVPLHVELIARNVATAEEMLKP